MRYMCIYAVNFASRCTLLPFICSCMIIHICMFMYCQYIYCKNFAKPSHICMDKNFAEFNFANSTSYPPGSSGWSSRTFIMFACTQSISRDVEDGHTRNRMLHGLSLLHVVHSSISLHNGRRRYSSDDRGLAGPKVQLVSTTVATSS